jgi:hypothetical protein
VLAFVIVIPLGMCSPFVESVPRIS